MTLNETYRQSVCASRLCLIAWAPNDAFMLNWAPARSIAQIDRVETCTEITSIWNPGAWLVAAVAMLAFATEPKGKILGDISL